MIHQQQQHPGTRHAYQPYQPEAFYYEEDDTVQEDGYYGEEDQDVYGDKVDEHAVSDEWNAEVWRQLTIQDTNEYEDQEFVYEDEASDDAYR